MRGCVQQIGRQLVRHADCWTGWLLAAAATVVYLLTLEPTASWWDCGEFIAISYTLQVGHPPGAPLYQLLAHVFSWLAGGNVAAVARCCNALSAVAGGVTVMFLYWTVLLLSEHGGRWLRVGAAAGAMCYCFCDTAWFSAVESEVYATAMLVASATVWAMLRWYRCENRRQAVRWLLLVAMLLGLGVCTHLLTLLTTPMLLLLFVFRAKTARQEEGRGRRLTGSLLLTLLLFFAIGLSPYLIIPIRAAANTPLNQGNPSNGERFKAYLAREQYEKAPLWPRMWRQHENDALYAASWCGGDTHVAGNMCYYGSYQLTYMYLRYLMWNFAGRYNDRQGYGSPQNGQFVTGVPVIDRQLVGTSQRPPDSLPVRGHNVYYLLPLLAGLLGAAALADDRRMFWAVMTLFLMGGVILNIYLNHPCYEPRERDYAYVLSFYAFCIFIAFGMKWIGEKTQKVGNGVARRVAMTAAVVLAVGTPTLMACENWDDHDRSGRYVVRDAGANILGSCEREAGAALFCYGDNDTFPLWYLQMVEGVRKDVQVENIGLMGWTAFTQLLAQCEAEGRPVYFTHYAYNKVHDRYKGRLQLEGNAYRLCDTMCDSVAAEQCYRHVTEQMGWHTLKGVYIDETSCKFLEQYWRDMVLVANNLSDIGETKKADEVLRKTLGEIALQDIQDVELINGIADAFGRAGNTGQCECVRQYLRRVLEEQLDYYHSIPPRRQAGMIFTIPPREELYRSL